MNTNISDNVYPFADEIYKITGTSMSILNDLGQGFSEKIYEQALVNELTDSGFKINQQKSFDVIYKGKILGTYVPDLIVNEEIIVELKTISKITDNEIGQVINYLKVTKQQLGLILNFKNKKLEWKRVILSE